MDSLIFKRGTQVSLKSRITFIGGFCLLVVAGIAAAGMVWSTAAADRWSSHSQTVRQAQAALFSAVQDAETGQRGYLLTGDPDYLGPFNSAKNRLDSLKADLLGLIGDNPTQQRRLAELSDDIDHKMSELERTISLYNAGNSADALKIVKTNQGRDLMNQIRARSSAFDEAEDQLLSERQELASVRRGVLLVLILTALLIAAVLAYFVTVAARKHASEIISQNAALQRERDGRERAEGMWRQAQKMEALGQLTGGVAHDFNNMLAIIIGNLDLLLRKLTDGDSRLRTLAENALNGAHRAATLTKRLLAFSRLQPLDPKPLDVNKCVSDMSEILRRSLGEHIAIETVLAGGLWKAFVDGNQLENAIINLAVNARDAMGTSGRLTIETSNAFLDRTYADQHDEVDPGQYVLVAITDTGSGMLPEVMEKAFEPFFTTKGVGEGTGLGLSQVHGFLKQSRGHIKLYSELGVGTTVKLYLPRDSGNIVNTEPARSIPSSRQREQVTVLVVEDDPGVRKFVVSALRELGFIVIEADSAAVALEHIDRNPEIAVLLTDVVMPGVTGRQLVDIALEKRPELKIIYMTGYTRNAIVHNGVLDAGTRLLTKPFTIEELDRELQDLIAR